MHAYVKPSSEHPHGVMCDAAGDVLMMSVDRLKVTCPACRKMQMSFEPITLGETRGRKPGRK